MKISLLMKREPFDKIFEETFTSFLNDFTHCPHKVKWYHKNNIKKNKESVQRWYCNPLINSIFVKGVNPAVFNSIIGEYSYNPLRPWRSFIQKLYLSLSRHRVTAQLMAKYVVEVSPPIKDSKNILIIGGNTKIRLIFLTNNKVYVILKNGFDKKYLEKELYVKTNFKYLPTPKIHTYGNNGLWYCEEYVSGISPDRIDKQKRQAVLVDALGQIHRMLHETKKTEPLNEYVKLLKKRISKNIDMIPYLDSKTKNNFMDLLIILINATNFFSDTNICIAYCHGDFQPGNIIYDGRKTWILDWEHSRVRQIGYDLFVLMLNSRVLNGFYNRFMTLINDRFDKSQTELMNNWPELKWEVKYNKKLYPILFLLEELDFHLEENNNNNFFDVSEGLTTIYYNIKKIIDNNKIFFNEK